jgi:hypothetical protein
LRFLNNCKLKINDLEHPESPIEENTDKDGAVELLISQHPGYRFLRYEVVDNK